MCVWRVLRLTIYLLVIMIALASAREYVDKRSPEDRQSWYLGSRYGRSSGGTNSRHLIVTPRRDDRFHPGSRYGKRTVTETDATDTDTNGSRTETEHQLTVPAATTLGTQDVECSYTGVADLYRCHINNRKENNSEDFMAN